MAHCSTYPVVPVALLVFGIVAILLLTVPTEKTSGVPDFMYGIVLDAGSSHTALYIYRWPADKHNGTGVVAQHTECHVKGGGISSYAGQKGAAARSLEPCLDQALMDVPRAKHRITPVYLGATAGMRLLSLSSPALSSQVLQEVGQKLQTYPFNYRGAVVLTGREEGLYGWVTVNYLLENFIKYGFVGRWLSPGRPTVGALDFGGASTQITFVTQDEVEDGEDMMKLNLYGQEYAVYTHSFLCYGRDQVLKRLLAHLVMSNGHTGTVLHPCFPADYALTVELNDVYDSPCTSERRPNLYKHQDPVRVVGTGHYEQCLANVSQIFSFNDCPYTQCSFDQVFQPNITGDFMAFSAFYYTHSFLERISGFSVTTPSHFEEAAKAVCKMTFDEMLRLAPEQKSRLQDYCGVAAFIRVLMLRGYGFNNHSFPHISFQKKVGDTSIGWALGYMLNLSSLIPAEQLAVRRAMTPAAWGALLSLFSLLLTSVLMFVLLRALVRMSRGGGDNNPI